MTKCLYCDLEGANAEVHEYCVARRDERMAAHARANAFEEAARICEIEYEIDGPGLETYSGGHVVHGQEAAAVGLAALIRKHAATPLERTRDKR